MAINKTSKEKMGKQRYDPESVGSPRIPVALQEVFLASNRGEEVDVAPDNGVAFRLFRRVRNTMVENAKSLSRGRQRQNTMNTSSSETDHVHSTNNNKKQFRLGLLYTRLTLSRPSTTTFGDLHVQSPRETESKGTTKESNRGLRVLTFRRVRNDEKQASTMMSQNQHKRKPLNNLVDETVMMNKDCDIEFFTNNHQSPTCGFSSEVSITYRNENDGPHSPSTVANFDEYDVEVMSCKIPDYMSTASMNPQSYLCGLLSRRGYSTKTYDTLNSGYHNDSTPLQEASYTTYIVALARDGKKKQLRKIFDCGIHPNPSNYYGESLIHLVCRLGSYETLKLMVDGGSCVQVCDDYGRTPLHDACWSTKPCMELVTLLLKLDRHLLFMTDCRGTVPLQYVSKDYWAIWREYIDSMVEEIFPVRPRSQSVIEHADEGAFLARMRPNTRPLIHKPNGLSMELIRLVATGRMEPEEIELLRRRKDCDVAITSDSSDGTSSDGSSSDESSSDDDSDSSDIYYDKSERKEDDDIESDEVTTDKSDISEYSDESEDDQDESEADVPMSNKFHRCNDSVGTGSWREDEMYMNEDDFEEMLERIAMAKKQAKGKGAISLKDY